MLLWLILAVVALYLLAKPTIENFGSADRIQAFSADGRVLSTCGNKAACIVADPTLRTVLTVFKHPDGLVSLQGEDAYLNACTGNDCRLLFDSHNPFIDSAKLQLVPASAMNSELFVIQLHDGSYVGIHDDHLIKVRQRNLAESFRMVKI